MKVLVTGATGRIGRQVVRALKQHGHEIRVLTRDRSRAEVLGDVEVVQGDLSATESVRPALAGMECLHLIPFDSATGTSLINGPELAAQIAAAGIQRVTTFRGQPRGPVEQALERSGLAWTDLFIPVEFMANVSGWAQEIREHAQVRIFGPPLSAMIHEADVGDVVAQVLANPGHAGQTYVLTGPAALSPQDKLQAIKEATGLSALRLVDMAEEEARGKWRSLGYPPEVVDFLAAWHKHPPESAYVVLPTVQQLLGRPARRFSEWVQEHRGLFIA